MKLTGTTALLIGLGIGIVYLAWQMGQQSAANAAGTASAQSTDAGSVISLLQSSGLL